MENIKARNLISVFVITVMVASIFAIPVFSDNYKVDAAAKKVSIKFNANGGKIGSAKTKSVSIAKGKKIGTKLPAAKKMKRDGYKFVGWYKKANGGSKISAKIKATKKATYYAKWKRVLNSAEKRLVGTWGSYYDGNSVYLFRADGTFFHYDHPDYSNFSDSMWRGYWSIKNGKITRTFQWCDQTNKDTKGYFEEFGYAWTPWSKWETSVNNILISKFGSDHTGYPGKEYIEMYRIGDPSGESTRQFIRDRVGSSYPNVK